jgi:hypothetical protein
MSDDDSFDAVSVFNRQTQQMSSQRTYSQLQSQRLTETRYSRRGSRPESAESLHDSHEVTFREFAQPRVRGHEVMRSQPFVCQKEQAVSRGMTMHRFQPSMHWHSLEPREPNKCMTTDTRNRNIPEMYHTDNICHNEIC